MTTKKDITGIILAGGKSSRMGSDKGLIPFKGKPFMAHILEALKPMVSEIIIVSDNKDHDVFNEYRVEDIIKDSGPLAGLYTGLKHSKTDLNLVLSCDVPLITTSVLKSLIGAARPEFDIIQAKYRDETLPLIGLYRKNCWRKSKELLDLGEQRLRALATHLRTYDLIIEKELENSIKDINTTDQLNTIRNEIEN